MQLHVESPPVRAWQVSLAVTTDQSPLPWAGADLAAPDPLAVAARTSLGCLEMAQIPGSPIDPAAECLPTGDRPILHDRAPRRLGPRLDRGA
jgi:hypothetical protein